MLKYAFMSEVAVKYAEWERKSIYLVTNYQYETNFLYPTSYVYDPTNTKTETNCKI